MSRSEIEYLRHIQDEARYLVEASHEVNFDEFVDDETLKRAFVRSIEVIGEATKNLSAEIRDRYPKVGGGERWPECAIDSFMGISEWTTRLFGKWRRRRLQN